MYDKQEIIEKALTAIETEECVTIEEVVLFLPISKRTFYDWGLHEMQDIKDAIERVKVRVKQSMRRKWRKSENPALQIAEFRLMATDDEIEKIAINKVKQENTHTIQGKPTINLIVSKP